MASGWNWTPDDSWRVTFYPRADDRLVRLHAGDFMIVLPALEAHKLGSALQTASGIDASGVIGGQARMKGGTQPTCLACFGEGVIETTCTLCAGSGVFDGKARTKEPS